MSDYDNYYGKKKIKLERRRGGYWLIGKGGKSSDKEGAIADSQRSEYHSVCKSGESNGVRGIVAVD